MGNDDGGGDRDCDDGIIMTKLMRMVMLMTTGICSIFTMGL